jgi:hypothetical protein
MSIIEYMNYFRKDTLSEFYLDVHPRTHILPYIENGTITQSQHVSEDGLVKTSVTRYKNLEDFNAIVNLNRLELRNQIFEFNKETNAPKKSPAETYKLVGINQPFKLTTTYTFPENSAYQSIFVNNVRNSLVTDGRFELHGVELIENGQTITIIEKFKDSNEYTTIRFADGYWVPQLYKMNVTKHLNYELI